MDQKVKPLTLRRGNKSRGGSTYYIANTPGESGYLHLSEIAAEMANGREVIFDQSKKPYNVDLLLLSILYDAETCGGIKQCKTLKGDTSLANRIIRNGGFIEYINQLESRL